jgi:lysyl-tRNA synthetase class 2
LPASVATLAARARILKAVRGWFDEQGFLEVDTPGRVRSPGQEVHLDAIAAGDGYWLITSPEYHMKRLVAAGCTRIVQIGKCWRAEELGPHHRTEFTMIEWYRAGEPLDALASDCEQLLRVAVQAAGRAPAELGVEAPFVRATVRELAARHAGIELAGDEDAAVLRAKLAAAGVQAGSATAWDDLFYQLFLDRIEPVLARSRPTFVFDWPTPLAALARPKPGDPRVVERFELYAGGLELANAFGELTDAAEQRRRFEDEARLRAERGKDVYPIDEDLLAALPAMPATAGIALGFDRLVMFALGAADIAEVTAFAPV